MANPIQLPEKFSDYDFRDMAKKESNPSNRIRLIAMANIQEKKTLTSIAEILKVHWKTIQTWLRNFREKGISGLYVQPKPGAPKKLNATIENWISDFLNALNEKSYGGQITGKQLHQLVEDKFSIGCSLRTIYNTLQRLKFSWVSARSIHPKTDLEQQEQYKKFSLIAAKINTRSY